MQTEIENQRLNLAKPEKNTLAIQELLIKHLTPTNQRSPVHIQMYF